MKNNKENFNVLCKVRSGVTEDKIKLDEYDLIDTGKTGGTAIKQMLKYSKYEHILVKPETYQILKVKGFIKEAK